MKSYKDLAKSEVEKLILKHNNLYAQGVPEISDYEFEKLQAYGEFLGIPVRNHADISKGFEKVEHVYKMVGLKDVYTEMDLLNHFSTKHLSNLYTMLKYDGIAIELKYIKGKLISAVTRGQDGIGDDITRNMDMVHNLVWNLDNLDDIVIYGEIVMLRKDFDALNKIRYSNKKPMYRSSRNLVSGSCKLLDANKKVGRRLTFKCYGAMSETVKFAHVKDLANYLVSVGYEFDYKLKPANITMSDWIRDYAEAKDVNNFEFDIDGIVLALCNLKEAEELGSTATHKRGSVAYKFSSVKATSTIVDSEFSVGASGKVTPVLHYEPTNLDGRTTTKASIYNKNRFLELNPAIGDNVTVTAGGEIIPKVVGITKLGGESIEFPENCPKCASKLVDKGEEAYCINNDCPARLVGRVIKFCSRPGLNINLGDKTAKQLVNLGLVKELTDVFKLDVNDLIDLEGYANVSAMKLKQSIINASKDVPFNKFLYALSIPSVSTGAAKLLATEYKDLRDLVNSSKDRLISIDGVGPYTAENIHSYMSSSTTLKTLERMDLLGVTLKYADRVSDLFKGISFVITGSFNEHNVSRPDIESIITSNGGSVKGSVSKRTDYLLAGTNAGSKLTKAQGLAEVTVIDYVKFKTMCNGK